MNYYKSLMYIYIYNRSIKWIKGNILIQSCLQATEFVLWGKKESLILLHTDYK